MVRKPRIRRRDSRRVVEDPIDAVYLWIDGEAPRARAELQRARLRTPPEAAESASASRFRDHGELRYSLRSLERYVPWIRRVHVVTLDEPPPWLDCTGDRCRHVSHAQIFTADTSRPSFNSLAIELQLHRIPGLSRRFVYLNDDIFFGRPVPRRAFIDEDDREILFLEGGVSPGPDVVGRAHEFTQRLIAVSGLRLAGPPAHAPQLLDRERLVTVESLWPDAHARTAASTFRSSDDLVMRVAYQAVALQPHGDLPPARPRALHGGPEYQWLMFTCDVRSSVPALDHVVSTRPRFICINDDLGEGALARRLGHELRRQLERMYPTPSRFECRPSALGC